MDSEQWQQVLKVFDRATDLEPGEREGYLSSALPNQPELQTEVRRLLESHDENPEFLEQPAADLALAAAGDGPFVDPARIGPYRVIERLGVGGMGTVYLAERDDDQYHQQVAIKLVKRGMDSEQIVTRFRAERQILASLNHPHIARIFDGGVAEDGRPYFVLEYIEDGLPIDRYCEKHELPLRRRLELFCQACSAVQHAHRRLVIHRDLKPSNLLVNAGGDIKLLDFGIAKLIDPASAELTHLALTQAEVRLLTPLYASPEQVRGEPLSTTSDVYSLGVLLYKLLTGEKPYRLEHETPASIITAICEQEPKNRASGYHEMLRRRFASTWTSTTLCSRRYARSRKSATLPSLRSPTTYGTTSNGGRSRPGRRRPGTACNDSCNDTPEPLYSPPWRYSSCSPASPAPYGRHAMRAVNAIARVPRPRKPSGLPRCSPTCSTSRTRANTPMPPR